MFKAIKEFMFGKPVAPAAEVPYKVEAVNAAPVVVEEVKPVVAATPAPTPAPKKAAPKKQQFAKKPAPAKKPAGKKPAPNKAV
jgi:hypothetical protein